MNAKMKEARALFDTAHELAEAALIYEARGYMRRLPEGAECVAGMGSISFQVPDGDAGDLPDEGAFADVLRAYIDMFGCTYGPWRFTRIGDVRRDW